MEQKSNTHLNKVEKPFCHVLKIFVFDNLSVYFRFDYDKHLTLITNELGRC